MPRTVAIVLLILFSAGQAAVAAQAGAGNQPAQQSEQPDARIAWLKKSAVAVRTIDPMDDDFADLRPLAKAIGTARVLPLGGGAAASPRNAIRRKSIEHGRKTCCGPVRSRVTISDVDVPPQEQLPPQDAPNVVQALAVFNNGSIERKRKDEPAMMFSHRPTGIPFLLLAIVLGCLTAPPAPVAAGELRLGVAAVKINPTIGTPMDGGFGENDCRGVLDDLFAKATVLDDGKTKVAMVVCDVCALTRPVVDAARRSIAEKTGIPAANAMISATHNHTGPRVVGDSVAEDALVTGGNKLNAEYSLQLSQWIAEAVEEAQKRLTPARVSYGHEDESKVSYIRRFWMRDGSVGWNPGSLNPNILRPIGQVDPQVNVIYAETAAKKPLLTYVNFPLHACTTAGSLASADFPGALARCLAFCKGPDMLTIFAQGACGNVNHLNVRWNQGQFSPGEAKRIGTILAGSVCNAYMDMKDVGDCTLRVRREMVSLDLGKYTEEDLREAREILARRGANTPFLQLVKACKVVDIAARRGKPIDAEIQVFALGQDIAWVSSPGELFVELGMSMKAGSRFPQTNVVELAGGPMYYIPNCSAYSEGQYEVVSTHYAAGSGERLVTAALRLLAELHQEAVKP